MTFDSLNTVFLTLAFLVPGYLSFWVLSALAPDRPRGAQESLLGFLALSCLNYALWAWLIYLVGTAPFFAGNAGYAAAGWFVILFLAPVGTGLLLGFLSRREIIRRLLQRIGFAPVHAIPTAWDYKFHRTEEPRWLRVTLKDGSQVAGLFGTDSSASSDPAERDLYLEAVYRIAADSRWERIPRTDGMLIRPDQIKWIEFWHN